MKSVRRLYLFTLEVDKLTVGKTYNPLPAHLTLVSRFYSMAEPDEIVSAVSTVFQHIKGLELQFDVPEILGPHPTAVDLVKSTTELVNLHQRLIESLKVVGAAYINPRFIGMNWRPHVSKRADTYFEEGDVLKAHAAYLIEVIITTDEQIRHIRHKFELL